MNYGIVAEFNPLHNGHKYLLDLLKQNGNTVTVVMSESFVQRGEPAFLSPYVRTYAALRCGVDLVLSLPVTYATAGAERFALGGVGVLNALGVVDTLAFGSECGNKAMISKCADVLLNNTVNEAIQTQLSSGVSFPTARQKAVSQYFGEEMGNILESPNDILGVEYVKALKKLKSDMDFYPVKRQLVSHDSELVNENFCSASALRNKILNNEDFARFVPKESCEIIKKEIKSGRAPVTYANMEKAILYKLRTMSVADYKILPDVSEGLEYRIYEAVRTSGDLNTILEKIKTKRYTLSRIRRILLCAFLEIKAADVIKPVPYIRVLGFNNKGAELLKKAKSNANLPVITKSADVSLSGDAAKDLYSIECKARDIFSLAQPEATPCGQVMTDKIIII